MTNMNRRGILLGAAAAVLTACGGGGDDNGDGIVYDSPGRIGGLGRDTGSVKGVKFTTPEGVETTQGWMGLYMGLGYLTAPNVDDLYPIPLNPFTPLKSAKAIYGNTPLVVLQGDPVATAVGFGIGVTARVPLVNRRAEPVEVVFPAGLVIPSKLPMYQSGVLLTESRVTISAGTATAVALATLGGSWHLAGSAPGALYDPGVVSSSATLQELVDLLRGKRLAYEHYKGDYSPYWEIVERMQAILRNLTDSTVGLEASDRAWIQGLPAL